MLGFGGFGLGLGRRRWAWDFVQTLGFTVLGVGIWGSRLLRLGNREEGWLAGAGST